MIPRNRKDKEVNPLEITDNDILNSIELVEIITNNINEPMSTLSNLSEETRYPLRGSVIRYEKPTEPVAMADWEGLK